MTPDDLLAELAIRRTINFYNVSGDRGRTGDMSQAFTEDAVLVTPYGTMEGRAQIAGGLSGGKTRGWTASFVRHNLTTSRIELTGPDTATGRNYFIVITDIGLDRTGVYHDRYRKVGGHWLIEHREVRLDYVADDTMLAPKEDAMIRGVRGGPGTPPVGGNR